MRNAQKDYRFTRCADADLHAGAGRGRAGHIDGDTVYYSGSIDSVETGVYRMTAAGAGASRLYEGVMTLLEAENGNILAIS